MDAFFQDEGYWHLFVALRCTDGNSLVFSTEDVGIAKYFEVFPIKVKLEPTVARAWRALDEPRTIQRVTPLFRHEWLEPSNPHPELVGGGPHHVHHAGRGPASPHAVQHVVVQAGVELQCASKSSLVVFASNTAPFNVEVAVSLVEAENALAAFTTTEA
ncbi:hypothetical protein [Pseudorhodoferax aquiterrae]|uniref:hypothetical protein n=1 Tax=Pseudorhodoferax aquiterrae TaxID=747304 RepID=UPI001676BE59|nr:hypothetical protein [Pseudorhodoferax aquiterrae]